MLYNPRGCLRTSHRGCCVTSSIDRSNRLQLLIMSTSPEPPSSTFLPLAYPRDYARKDGEGTKSHRDTLLKKEETAESVSNAEHYDTYDEDGMPAGFDSTQRATVTRQPRSSDTLQTAPDDAMTGHAIDEEVVPYIDQPNVLLPPPDFHPFFTLIEDSATGEHHHPSVHYIFSDDDPEPLTSACLAAAEANTPLPPAESAGTVGPPAPTERYILLDVAADGRTVQAAQSLSAEWQVVQTHARRAPSFADAKTAGEEGGRGLMLRVVGTEMGDTSEQDGGRGKGAERLTVEAVEAMMRAFEQRLGLLDGIMASEGGDREEGKADVVQT
ncbi:hypothetical protein LTR50_002725 [Elasticomyces elasticus]|nr:hypothetical protein LTR50_002725 [Elasticomyces elasticus]